MKTDKFIIHAVYDDKDKNAPIDYHTHGLEKYGLKNICMERIGKEYVNTCGSIINRIAESMIDGETYRTNIAHYIDDGKGHLLDVFKVHEKDKDCLKIDYMFGVPVVYPEDNMIYIFDSKHDKWHMI